MRSAISPARSTLHELGLTMAMGGTYFGKFHLDPSVGDTPRGVAAALHDGDELPPPVRHGGRPGRELGPGSHSWGTVMTFVGHAKERAMSIQDDKKELNAAGADIPADTYGNRAERVAEAEDHDATRADTPLPDDPGRVAVGSEEHRVSDEPPERNINPRE
jgi:hypothetical protein